jgi:flagellar motor switch protein FliN
MTEMPKGKLVPDPAGPRKGRSKAELRIEFDPLADDPLAMDGAGDAAAPDAGTPDAGTLDTAALDTMADDVGTPGTTAWETDSTHPRRGRVGAPPQGSPPFPEALADGSPESPQAAPRADRRAHAAPAPSADDLPALPQDDPGQPPHPAAPFPAEDPPVLVAPDRKARQQAAAAAAERLGLPPTLARIDVTVTVEVGRTRMTLSEIASVTPGELVELDRMTEEPVDVLVNGRLFARGEIVAIGAAFGVRLTELAGDGA